MKNPTVTNAWLRTTPNFAPTTDPKEGKINKAIVLAVHQGRIEWTTDLDGELRFRATAPN